jgi:adenosylhomocysteine nucleosidase
MIRTTTPQSATHGLPGHRRSATRHLRHGLALAGLCLGLSSGSLSALAATASGAAAAAQPSVAADATTPRTGCLSDCTLRIGIVSAFGAEADILLAQVQHPKVWMLNGNRFTTGELQGHRVVIVLSGVSMINSAMTTQLMLDHFRIDRLIMSGIAGGVNPAHHVGDVTIPDRWAMPMEVYWNSDNNVPAPCGAATDVSCLGLKLATPDGKPVPPLTVTAPQGNPVDTGLFVRENFVMNAGTAPKGEYRFDYPVDPQMLAVAKTLKPDLQRCGPKARMANGTLDERQCMHDTPRVIVGGRGLSGTAFLANAQYRKYLAEQFQGETFEMETAALAHVAYANQVPYIAFRSLSDLAGAEEFNADVAALFSSGLAETNEAAVTLAFLQAWVSPRTAVRSAH